MTNINADNNRKYGFIVNSESNKIEIARAIELKFNVKVDTVNTLNYKGKNKTQFTKRGKFSGKTPKFKKAIITLKEGNKIDLFEQV
jgi:large subunit ribosomal protein L23